MLKQLRQHVGLNFYRCHLAYFVVTILIASIAIWGSNTQPPNGSPKWPGIGYFDALFLATSAMTTTGLNTVNLSAATGYQQSVLFVLALLGDLSLTSISVVFVRRWYFVRHMSQKVAKSAAARRIVEDIDQEAEARSRQDNTPLVRQRFSQNSQKHAERPPVALDMKHNPTDFELTSRHKHLGGVMAPWESSMFKTLTQKTLGWIPPTNARVSNHHYVSFDQHLDDRGRMRNLNDLEYEEMGGVEYRGLRLLSWIIATYVAFWILVTLTILAPYASKYTSISRTLHNSQPGKLNPAWWGVFISASSYTNCGMSPLNASMTPFHSNWLILIVTGTAAVAGNTFYPVFLRVYIWLLRAIVPKKSKIHHSLSFLLHHPRRCYLWLFDKRTTCILAATQLGLILTEWALFGILNIDQPGIESLSPSAKTAIGLYQSIGTRSVGFYAVVISKIAPGLQILYCAVMYLSIFPLLISLRNSNIYEERSIGLNAEQLDAQSDQEHQEKPISKRFTRLHIQNQLAYDLWWIVLTWILIAVIERPQLNNSQPGYSIFALFFEVISAYGNCGLSLGVPGEDFSLSAKFHILSKLILIAVMIRGRHRILPLAIDRSILLPGQGLMEEMDKHYNPTLREEHELEGRIREAERGEQAEQPEGRQDPE